MPGGAVKRRRRGLAPKRKAARQGSAAPSGDTPAVKKQRRRPNASAGGGGRRGRKRTATSQAADGEGYLERSDRSARKDGVAARRSMERTTLEAACHSRDMSLLGPGEQGRRMWRMSVATSYLLSLYSDTAHKTPAPPTMWGGTGGIVAQVRRHMKVAQGSSGSVRKIIEHA